MMFVRRSLVLGVLVAGCGPEAGVLPRTGVYDTVHETLANDCGQGFDDSASMDSIVYEEDRLRVGFPDFPNADEGVYGGWIQSWVYPSLERDPAGDGFGAGFDAWFEWDGCRTRKRVEVEVPADDVVQTRVTYQWERAGACKWLGSDLAACTMVRETTATLRAVCEDCNLEETQNLARAVWAEEHPPPK